MKIYDSGRAPNPRRVKIFMAEKGISVPLVQIDINKFEHRTDAFSAINSYQQVPVLELDDGTFISESVAICRYFEELQPEPPLFGVGAKASAVVEMWNRNLELYFLSAVFHTFRHLHPAMVEREVPQVAAWGEVNKIRVLQFLEGFDDHLAKNQYAAGSFFSIADITGGVAVDFMKPAKLLVPVSCKNVLRWHGEISSRSSWSA